MAPASWDALAELVARGLGPNASRALEELVLREARRVGVPIAGEEEPNPLERPSLRQRLRDAGITLEQIREGDPVAWEERLRGVEGIGPTYARRIVAEARREP